MNELYTGLAWDALREDLRRRGQAARTNPVPTGGRTPRRRRRFAPGR